MNMTPEQIEAAGKVLNSFAGVELILIILSVVAIIFIFVLGPKILDKRYKYKMAEMNKENQTLQNETNEMVKAIAKNRDVIEKTLHDQSAQIEKLNTGYQSIENMEKMMHDAVLDRKKRHTSLEKEMKTVKTNVKDIFSVLTDHSKEMLINTLFSENKRVKTKEKLKAYLRLIGLKENGDIKKQGFDIIVHNKEPWLEVIKDMKELRITVLDEKYFHNTLEEINRHIFDGMMW
jgi:hypothetical protein